MTSEDKKKILDDYVSAMLRGFVSQAKAVSILKHPSTKGQLREIFVRNLLIHFLPSHLNVGTGHIINNQSDESKETDVIIYDNRILRPFLTTGKLNLFPVESVVGTIEVKSSLGFGELKQAEANAAHLVGNVIKKNRWLQPEPQFGVMCAVFGLGGTEIRALSGGDTEWITKKVSHLSLICSVGKFSWALLDSKGKVVWRYGNADESYGEVRRFLGIFVDNLRTVSHKNWETSTKWHRDWLGQYIRVQ